MREHLCKMPPVEGRETEEERGTLGPEDENKSKVNVKDGTGRKERVEFRSRREE